MNAEAPQHVTLQACLAFMLGLLTQACTAMCITFMCICMLSTHTHTPCIHYAFWSYPVTLYART